MKGHAVLEAAGDHAMLQVADFRHPEAVESLLDRIDRDGELPLFACCAEDLEAVRRHVRFASTPRHATEIRTVPRVTKERRQEPRRTVARQRNSSPASAEQRHASMTFLGISAVVIVAIIWQLGLWGVTAAYTSYAADEAARAASVGSTTTEVRDGALRSVPSWFRTKTDVSQTAVGTVKVTSSMPVIMPIFTVDGLDLTSEAPIVAEDA